MKKIVLFIGAAFLALTSCSKSDPSESATTGLVKTITTANGTTTYTYNSNKILKSKQGNDSLTFGYYYQLITQITAVVAGNSSTTIYTYGNGQLNSSVTKANSADGTTSTISGSTNYTYNFDGTITIQQYSYPDSTAVANGSQKLTFLNGNILKAENFDSTGTSTDVTTYQYDTSSNPYKKILGYDKLLIAGVTGINNVVQSTKTSGSGTLTTTVTTNVYTYNSDNYPLTKNITTVTTVGTGVPTTTTSAVQYTY